MTQKRKHIRVAMSGEDLDKFERFKETNCQGMQMWGVSDSKIARMAVLIGIDLYPEFRKGFTEIMDALSCSHERLAILASKISEGDVMSQSELEDHVDFMSKIQRDFLNKY